MSDPTLFVGNIAGVYMILNMVTRDCYIGSTNSLRRRRAEHTRWLRANRHHSPHLQHAWNLYGEASFTFEVLEVCPAEDRIPREQHYIDVLHPVYNSLLVAGEMPKGGGTPANREAVRQHATGNTYRVGKKHSPETIERLRCVMTGRSASEDTRRKMSESHKGIPVSERTRQATILRNKAREWTPEQRQALSASKKAAVTPEFRASQALKATGKTATPEARMNMSLAQTGRTHSAETKARISSTNKLRWAKRKGLVD